MISSLFRVAGYTYGPILGLYAYGISTKWQLEDKFVPIVCVISPIISYFISVNSESWFNYSFGFDLLILNGFITFISLDSLRKGNYEW